MSETLDQRLALPEAPFRGAEPFRLIDRPIFFERKAETRHLLREVIIYRGVLLYGDSGAGKSSLINAGLIPAALDEGFTADRIRLNNLKNAEITVERISLRDDDRPPFLRPSLADRQGGEGRAVFSVAEFRKTVADFSEQHYPLLIFDQFEEFATLFEEALKPEEIRDARRNQEAILEMLFGLLRDRRTRVKLLFSFREDYLAKLTKLFVLCPELQQQYVRLLPPDTDALREIIAGPFRDPELLKHFSRTDAPAQGFSEKLVSDLETEFKGRSRGGVINLTEVQLACLELWKAENPEQLYQKEQVGGLLRLHMERAVEKLEARGLKGPGVTLLSYMVTSQGTRNVISEYDLLAQVRGQGYGEAELRRALDALVTESKLVRRVILREAPYYEIISEFLAPWIAKTRREREELQSERNRQSAIRVQRLQRYTRIAWAVLTFLALGAITYSLYSEYQRGNLARANQELQEAGRRQSEADARAAELRAQSEALQAQLVTLQKMRDEAERAADEARDRAAVAERRASLLVPAASRRRLQQLEAEVARLQDERLKLEAQLEESEDRIRSLESRLSQASGGSQVDTAPSPSMPARARRGDGESRRSNMFGSAMLEVALALLLMYFILGLVCSALGELLEAFLKFRAKYLYDGIKRLLGVERGNPYLRVASSDASGSELLTAEQFFEHPLIRSLGGEGRAVSYIPARTFALALTDIAAPVSATGARNMREIREYLAAMPNKELRRSLLVLFDGVEDIEQALANIEAWYEDAMDRVSSRFRRHAGAVLLALAFALALGLNVDTINIAVTVSTSGELRRTVAAIAESYAAAPLTTPRSIPTPTPTPADPAAAPMTTTRGTPMPAPADPTEELRAAERRVEEVRSQFNEVGLPIGWSSAPQTRNPRGVPSTSTEWLRKLVGCALTALIVSQLALLLFDLFNRVAHVRSAHKPRETATERPPKTASAPGNEYEID